MSDLVFTPAYQLAEMIRDRAVCSVEVLDAHLEQIAKHNSKLNAICTLDEERARQRAKLADEALARGENWGILHGVPITIKDIFETAGLRTTAGYKPLKDYIPQQDATAVARLRAAGAIILGKTNPAELASDYQGTNDLFPRVNNPWNLNYTPGGSSSGNAAAIAAGLSPLDLGDDIAGSLRQPAHFCGIFTLKPIDTVLMGSKTYYQVLTFGEYPYKDKKGFVFSKTVQVERDNNVEFVKENWKDFINALRQSSGDDIWLVGGSQTIHYFMKHGLVDELILSIHPILLGNGIPLIVNDPSLETALELKDVKTYDSGLLQVSYDLKKNSEFSNS